MRRAGILAVGVLAAVLPSTSVLADVSVRASIRTENPISDKGAQRIRINTANNWPGVCRLTGTVQVFTKNNKLLCTYVITRSSVKAAGFSPIGLHTTGDVQECVGKTDYPLVVVDLVDDPGVTVKFNPDGIYPKYGDCGHFDSSTYTFCTEDNQSGACDPVRRFDLDISAE